MAYEAIISTLTNVRKLEGSDFIQIAVCNGYNVVVDITTKDNDIVI